MTISPGPIRGDTSAIPSKSHLHRLLICAALSDGETILHGAVTRAADIAATLRCLEALGACARESGESLAVTPIDRSRLPKNAVLNCGESGSTLRFLLPVAAALGVEARFQMEGRLPERPMGHLETALRLHGCSVHRPDGKSLSLSGRLTGGNYALPGNISSQYVTGLLLALPLIREDSALEIAAPLESEAYVNLTLETLRAFGADIRRDGTRFAVRGGQRLVGRGRLDTDGDWSNAAFWLCAGAMPGGRVVCRGLSEQSVQGDRAVVDLLGRMGANISRRESGLLVSEGRRRAAVIDASGIPDLIPPLAAVAAAGVGVTRIENAGRLRLKESDRLTAVTLTLNALGADLCAEGDRLIINGVSALTGGTVDSWGDHRIAMMAAIASAACAEPVTVRNAGAVDKSYPGFWRDLAALNKTVEETV